MTEKMYPPGTTDGTIQRLEAKIARLERQVKNLKKDMDLEHSRGYMEGGRNARRQV